ncbi:hypothetical protein SUDANB105_07525 [Streptomyces sp. enrichment culture]|uniref:hypothetical protein n=1 Tax=Streptomyces sp. enrichment culture TaxID=1795815 RepID=UPI003F56C5A9
MTSRLDVIRTDMGSAGRVQLPAELRRLLNGTVEAKVQQEVDRVVAALELARDRVLAHQSDPKRFPLPSGRKSLENLMLQHVKILPAEEQKTLASEAVTRVTSVAARRQHYGDLAGVDPKSVESVTDQWAGLKLASPFSPEQIKALRAATGATPPAGRAFARLDLEIGSVHCVEKTKNFGELDSKDEMTLSASVVGAQVRPVSREVDLGKFGTGDKKSVSPSPFLSFDLARATFPFGMAIQFGLVEHDRGNTPKNKDVGVILTSAEIAGVLFGSLFAHSFSVPGVASLVVTDASGAVLLGTTGVPVAASPVGVVVCAAVAVASAASLIVRGLRALGEDEIYPLVEAPPILMGSVTDGSSPEIGRLRTLPIVATSRSEHFTGHYEVTYRWRLR